MSIPTVLKSPLALIQAKLAKGINAFEPKKAIVTSPQKLKRISSLLQQALADLRQKPPASSDESPIQLPLSLFFNSVNSPTQRALAIALLAVQDLVTEGLIEPEEAVAMYEPFENLLGTIIEYGATISTDSEALEMLSKLLEYLQRFDANGRHSRLLFNAFGIQESTATDVKGIQSAIGSYQEMTHQLAALLHGGEGAQEWGFLFNKSGPTRFQDNPLAPIWESYELGDLSIATVSRSALSLLQLLHRQQSIPRKKSSTLISTSINQLFIDLGLHKRAIQEHIQNLPSDENRLPALILRLAFESIRYLAEALEYTELQEVATMAELFIQHYVDQGQATDWPSELQDWKLDLGELSKQMQGFQVYQPENLRELGDYLEQQLTQLAIPFKGREKLLLKPIQPLSNQPIIMLPKYSWVLDKWLQGEADLKALGKIRFELLFIQEKARSTQVNAMTSLASTLLNTLESVANVTQLDADTAALLVQGFDLLLTQLNTVVSSQELPPVEYRQLASSLSQAEGHHEADGDTLSGTNRVVVAADDFALHIDRMKTLTMQSWQLASEINFIDTKVAELQQRLNSLQGAQSIPNSGEEAADYSSDNPDSPTIEPIEPIEGLKAIGNTLQEGIASIKSQLQNRDGVQNLYMELLEQYQLPFKTIIKRLENVAYSTASAEHKQLNLHWLNEDTPIDRQILQQSIEPLEYIIRYAVRHCIAPASRFWKQKKQAKNSIRIDINKLSTSLLISIQLEAIWLDITSIGAMAVQRKIISKEQLLGMAEREIAQLIFEKDPVSEAAPSDVAQSEGQLSSLKAMLKNMEASLHIKADTDKSTTFYIEFPPTQLANVLIVHSGEQVFALLVDSIEAVQPVTAEALNNAYSGRTISFENQEYQYLFIGELLDTDPRPSLDTTAEHCFILYHYAKEPIALHVTKVAGIQEVVLCPLPTHFDSLPFAGVALLKQGDMAITLDNVQLFEQELL